jgi:hypothetical protein
VTLGILEAQGSPQSWGLRARYECATHVRDYPSTGSRSTAGRAGPVVGRSVRTSGSRPLLPNEIVEHWDLIRSTLLLRWSSEAGKEPDELLQEVQSIYKEVGSKQASFALRRAPAKRCLEAGMSSTTHGLCTAPGCSSGSQAEHITVTIHGLGSISWVPNAALGVPMLCCVRQLRDFKENSSKNRCTCTAVALCLLCTRHPLPIRKFLCYKSSKM